jgi:CHASE3 domain sensor protein
MQNRLVRTGLVLLALASLAGAGYKLFLMERQADGARQAATAFDANASALVSNILDLRASQQAYVAQGQNVAFWTSRATTLTDSIKQELEKLRPLAVTADAQRLLADAANSLDVFERIDANARNDIRNEQILLASDLIFTDGFEALKTLGTAVDDARAHEARSRDRSAVELRKSQIYLGAAAVGVCFGVLLFLAPLPGGRRPEVEPAAAAASDDSEAAKAATRLEAYKALMAQDAPASLKPVDSAGRVKVLRSGDGTGAAAAVAMESPAATAAAGPKPGEQGDRANTGETLTATLVDAAKICADLARVAEAQELPGLLQRAAVLLDASGIIVWLQDPLGVELRPAIGHGYSAQVMARLTAIPREADNATAAAYRAGELRVVEAEPDTPGAVVIPLLTAQGPAGAIAAEIRHGGETRRATQAIATILAAQISTLVSVGTGNGS